VTRGIRDGVEDAATNPPCRLVGWAMRDRADSDMVLQALLSAVWRRKPRSGVLVHSDQGSVYTSDDWQKFLSAHGLICSMSRRETATTTRRSRASLACSNASASQFTSADFIGLLKKHEIAISMDGTGCWRDNVFIERLWKSVKYEEVYLRAYETVSQARESLRRYFDFYNTRRPHSALDGQTPDKVYFPWLPLPKAA
jgi:transposase InsO family protein